LGGGSSGVGANVSRVGVCADMVALATLSPGVSLTEYVVPDGKNPSNKGGIYACELLALEPCDVVSFPRDLFENAAQMASSKGEAAYGRLVATRSSHRRERMVLLATQAQSQASMLRPPGLDMCRPGRGIEEDVALGASKRDPIANIGPVGGGGSRSTVEIRGELSQAMSYAEGEIASIAFESLRQRGEVRERKRDVSMPWKYGLSIPCRDNAHTGAFYRIPRPTNTWKTKTKPAVAPMASALRSQHTPYNPQGSPHTTGPRPASAPPLSLRFELALSSLPHRNGPYQAPGSGDTPVPLSRPLFKPRQFERMASAQPFPGLCPDCAFDCKSAHHLRICLKKRQRLAMAGGIFSLDELYQERGIPRSPSPNLSPDAQLRPNTAAASGNSKARHAFPEPAAQPEPVTDANRGQRASSSVPFGRGVAAEAGVSALWY